MRRFFRRVKDGLIYVIELIVGALMLLVFYILLGPLMGGIDEDDNPFIDKKQGAEQ